MLRSFYLQWRVIYTPLHKSVQNIHRTKYMPLRVEIEQQETLERNQIKGGLEKLRKDTLHSVSYTHLTLPTNREV